MRNALRYRSARRAAATDALTGLANRGALEHHMDRELVRADVALCTAKHAGRGQMVHTD